MIIFVLKNYFNRDMLCYRFPLQRGNRTLFPINKGIILIFWFHIIYCFIIISAVFPYFFLSWCYFLHYFSFLVI
jgi:hypothetical protein